MQLQSNQQQDIPKWKWRTNKVFFVKSYYRTMHMGLMQSEPGNLWDIKAPTRVLIFGWLMLKNKILIDDNLILRGCHLINICYMCKKELKPVKHMFGLSDFTFSLKRMIKERWCQYLLNVVILHKEAFETPFYTLHTNYSKTNEFDIVLCNLEIEM